jgi:hypothetical protein
MRLGRSAHGLERVEWRFVGEAFSARLSHILDLLAEDSRLNIHTRELEVRPPGAPTIRT